MLFLGLQNAVFDQEPDFMDEIIAESTARDPLFPQLLEAAMRKRRLVRALAERRIARGLSQTAVCEKTGISQGQLSRYVNGENRPPPEAFENLAKIFPIEDRVQLLLAYLADEIPAGLRNLVSVTPRSSSARIQEESATYRSRMPKDLRAAYDFLGNDALENPATADWIIANHRRLKPR